MRKLIHSKLVSTAADLDVQQKDPNSPLYSVKTFEALNLLAFLSSSKYIYMRTIPKVRCYLVKNEDKLISKMLFKETVLIG